MAVFLKVMLVLLWTVASVHAACPPLINGHWNAGDEHRYVLNGPSWTEVDGRCLGTVRTHPSKCDEVCKSNGGRWATVSSDAQHNWFTARGKAVDNNIWIGLTDNAIEGLYQWTNPGDAFTYSNWGPGEPKNDETKNCVVMWRFAEPRGSYGWVTSSCTAGKIYCGCATDVLAFPEPTAVQASASIAVEGLPVVDAAPAPACPAGWVGNLGKCYLATSPKKDYASCLSHCTGLGATMPCVMNALENDFLARLYPPAQMNDELVYLGYNDIQSEGTFQWQAGCSSTYSNFSPGEPNNWNNNEDCAAVYTHGLNMWNDLSCSEVAHCVCERLLPSQNTISYSATAYLQNAISTAETLIFSSTSHVDYPAARTACPQGWENKLGKCYLTTNPKQDYASCLSTCAGLGATLPCVMNSAENAYVASIYSNPLTDSNYTVYLGLNDIDTEGTFQWQAGCASTMSNFAPGEPNNQLGIEDCTAVYTNGLTFWNDMPCSVVAYCVCEKPLSAGVPSAAPTSTAKPTALPSTVAPSAAPTAPLVCPEGWENKLGKCYLTTNPPMSHAQCANHCAGLGATLPCVMNPEENAYLAGIFGPVVAYGLYLGLNDIAVEGSYQWQAGCSSSYRNFMPDEPNDYHGIEDCVIVHQHVSMGGQWNDVPCAMAMHCVCEKGATTAPFLAFTSTPVNRSHCSCTDCAAAYSASQPLASHASSCSLYCYENC